MDSEIELEPNEKIETDRLFRLLLKSEDEFLGIRNVSIIDDGDGTLSGKTDFCEWFTINQNSLVFHRLSGNYGYGRWAVPDLTKTGYDVYCGDRMPDSGKELHLRMLKKFRDDMRETLKLSEYVCGKLGI